MPSSSPSLLSAMKPPPAPVPISPSNINMVGNISRYFLCNAPGYHPSTPPKRKATDDLRAWDPSGMNFQSGPPPRLFRQPPSQLGQQIGQDFGTGRQMGDPDEQMVDAPAPQDHLATSFAAPRGNENIPPKEAQPGATEVDQAAQNGPAGGGAKPAVRRPRQQIRPGTKVGGRAAARAPAPAPTVVPVGVEVVDVGASASATAGRSGMGRNAGGTMGR
ncbi:hypothetical protein QBC37DRAFT_426092 [Rhypophila decipiens]|uniref:Uncharacterized protein n=1 Tax=Rhypophila decipiens TaxID=261697 RepID=A0AAN6Y4U9_9PEZI|nr:hypothetical protein QBC37DRAFT_426092 [Rhypophila decipiens]